MDKVLNVDKLEQLLLKSWAEILNVRKILAFVMTEARDTNDFMVVEEDDLPNKSVELTLSRFHLTKDGFLIWADFTVPRPQGFAIGTSEFFISFQGNIKPIRTVGQILKRRSIS